MATSRRNPSTTRRATNRSTAAKTSVPVDVDSPSAEAADPGEREPSEYSVRPIEQIYPPTEPFPEEVSMSTPEVIEATATPAKGNGSATEHGGAIEILNSPSLSAENRPVMSDDFEIAGTIQSAGVRPIEASHMAIYGTILNGRPITSSNLKVAEMMPGNRPIFYSDFHSVEGSEAMGRPVMVSEPGLLSAEMLLGNRPVFSNQADDASSLMGFID